jgi:hypothetical protein
VISLYFPNFPYKILRVKLRFEVLFKKFHPRLNLTTRFFPKPILSYLLNTIKLFLGHATWSLGPKQQNLKSLSKVATLWNLYFKTLSMRCIKLVQEVGPRSQYFSFLASKGEAVSVTLILCHTGTGNFRSIEYHHALYLILKTLDKLWPWAIGRSLKIKVSEFFHRHHEILDPQNIILPYIENLGLWSDWRVGHRHR